jgi:hypothetical protein
MNLLKNYLALLSVLLITGCSFNAPVYQPDFNLVNELKENSPPMKTGEFDVADQSLNKLSMRGSSLNSPYNNSYADYLKVALEEELKQSMLWDPASAIEVSATLTSNDVSAGISVGSADVSARFVVKSSGQVIYDKKHSAHHEWPSSLIAAIALPAAQENYQVVIQKLLRSFLLDKDLRVALNKG